MSAGRRRPSTPAEGTRSRDAASLFPLVTSRIAVGPRTWTITAVENQEALLDNAAALERFPYGFLVWESSIALGMLFEAKPERVRGVRILEIGAGVGLPGMVARSLGAEVHQTDHQPGALELAEQNARANGVYEVHRFVCDWRAWNVDETYPVILGADILYDRSMHYYIRRILERNLAPGGHVLLSDPGRPQALEFVSSLESAGWSVAMDTLGVPALPPDSTGEPVEVAIYTCRR